MIYVFISIIYAISEIKWNSVKKINPKERILMEHMKHFIIVVIASVSANHQIMSHYLSSVF